MNNEIWQELEDFASKASGDNGRKVFGANRLRDNSSLTEREIAERVRPKFYDAMKCGEADAIDKATQLGLNLQRPSSIR